MTFASGIRQTVEWYLDASSWISNVRTGAYRDWMTRHYGDSAVS
jgi:dTDP-glucose 4,6-dehydratase